MTRALQPGEVVDGRFRIEAELGSGGMGAVYRAVDAARGGRAVALKVLHWEEAGDEEAWARFEREAQVAASVDKHGGIVRIHSLGRHRGLPYFVMDLVEGRDLEKVYCEDDLGPRRVAEIVEGVARTLGACHAQGVVHRDLKPANILIDPAGKALVADFGLARGADADRLTRTGQLLGTPDYMAPEQAFDSKRATEPGVDVYSLGAILYRGLAGRPPFQGVGVHDVLLKLAEEEPAPPSSSRAGLAPDLEAVCLKALAKAPADRYPTAAEMADDLARYLRGESVSARPGGTRRVGWVKVAFGVAAALLVAGPLALQLHTRSQLDAAVAELVAWDAEVLSPYGLGLGPQPEAAPAPEEARAFAKRCDGILRPLREDPRHEAMVDRAARAEAQVWLDRGREPPAKEDEHQWNKAVRALVLEGKKDLLGALEALPPLPDDPGLPGLAGLRRRLATAVIEGAVAKAREVDVEVTRAQLVAGSEALRSLGEEARAGELKVRALDAGAEEWASALKPLRSSAEIRAVCRRLQVVTRTPPVVAFGPELTAAADRLLHDRSVEAIDGNEVRYDLFELEDGLLRADHGRKIQEKFREAMDMIALGSRKLTMETVLAILRAGGRVRVDPRQVIETLSPDVLRQVEIDRPNSRALRYAHMVGLHQKVRGPLAVKSLEAEEQLRQAYLGVLRADGLVPDLADSYLRATAANHAELMLSIGRAKPKDWPGWDEAWWSLNLAKRLTAGDIDHVPSLINHVPSLINIEGHLTHCTTRDVDAAVRVWAEGLPAVEAKVGPKADTYTRRGLVHGYGWFVDFLLAFRPEDREAAVAAGRKAVELTPREDPNSVRDAAEILGRVYLHFKDYDAAEATLAPVMDHGLKQAVFASLAVRVALRAGRLDVARRRLEEALKHNPNALALHQLREALGGR